MAMRKRPTLTELRFDQKVEALQAFAREAVSPFGDRSLKARQERIARAEWDYDFFCATYLPHYFDTPSGEFHGDLIHMAQRRPDPNRAVVPSVAAAPRGFGKSTPVAFAYPLWETLYKRRHCIIIGSETASLSEEHVASIAAELTDNQRIIYDFAPVVLVNKKGRLVLKDTSIFGKGAGQQIRGIKHGPYRPDLVVLDDLENDKLAINPKRVKFLLRWIVGTVYPGIGKTGTLIIIGTIIDRRSALATMLHSPDEPWCNWNRRTYRAITEDGKSLWPEMYSLELLESKRATMGPTLFNQEYMNDPRNESGLFQEGWLQTYDPDAPEFQAKLKAGHLIAGGFCDPSARSGESNDYKAVVTVLLDITEMIYYVPDAFIRHCSTKAAALAIAEREKRFAFWKFGIEDNGFQALFVEEVERVAAEEKVSVTITGVTHTGLSKEMRLAGLSPLVERGKVRFLVPRLRNADYSRLMEQLIFYPSATVHDDGPDALEGAVSLLKKRQHKPFAYESVAQRRTADIARGAW